uniref:Pre-mRNA processing factor 4B n=1 Tax=Rousettus aegyptiacus TaxID=9407 RepID=A0A7J8KEV1_ROUAE|nr:pre-mRNA processing factor 4B [Rousettus aegyptiacus]
MIDGLSRANRLLELSLLVEEPRADPWKESEENQKGDDFLLQERDLEMISSVDVKDQKMPAQSIGGLQPEEEQVDPPLEGGLVPHSDVAGLPEEEADLLGEEIEVEGADPG